MYFRKIAHVFWCTAILILMISCNGQKEKKENMPTYLYKILSIENWAQSCKTVHLSSMDAPFIHLSTESQLEQILEKYWTGASEYVVLKVEAEKLTGKLVLEANPGGTNKYYHLYNGSIPLSSIVELKVHQKQKA